MKNNEIAEIFEKMGTLLEIQGENPFKIKAYFKAASNIQALGEDIAEIKSENRLADIPGVGKALQEKIIEYIDKGKISAYQKLIKDVPETLFDVVNIPSVGPKKAKLFFQELNVKSISDLKKALGQGKLEGLAGIKEKTIENIRKGISVVEQGQKRMLVSKADRVATEVIALLKKLKSVKDVSVAGSLRRGKETIGDIDILVSADASQKIMDAFVAMPQVKKINAHGETKSSVLMDNNVQVDLRVVEPKYYGAALLYFTGSKNFNIKLRQIAQKQKKKVNEYGVFSVEGNKETYLAGKTETDCFKALGLDFVPPELREDIAQERLFVKDRIKIPELIEISDIKGDLHTHSTWSDGKNTIEEMVNAARDKGYEYLAVTDHSYKLKVAKGVSAADLKKKKKEIDQLNAKLKGFRVLFGSEVEIDMEGNLDYNDTILSEFDIVIAAIHSGFEQDSKALTKRLIKACQNRHVNLIAHPTGVHIGKRQGYSFDFEEVCKAAVDNNVFLEINSSPVRLDLNSQNTLFAKDRGIRFAIDTDAHNVDHLDYMKFGISIAKRGWLGKNDVLNTLKIKDLEKELRKK